MHRSHRNARVPEREQLHDLLERARPADGHEDVGGKASRRTALSIFQDGGARSRATISAALVVLVFLIYAQVHTHSFINFDDPRYVSANPNVLGGLTWANIVWAFTHIHAAYWIPVTWMSHMLDVQLFGTDAGAHLLVSAALHAIDCVLLFLFLFNATSAVWPSAAVAALFAAHPLHVESVAWAAERKDTLSTFFFLLCLLGYTQWIRKKSRIAYWSSVVALAVGMMAKPMLVSTPIVLLLLDYWPYRRTDWRKALIEKIPFLIAIVPSAIATLFAQSVAMPELAHIPVPIRFANAAISYVRYLAKTIWPTNLAIIYPYPKHLSLTAAVVCALLLIAATVAVIRYRQHAPWLLVGWLWFVITLIPVIGIVQVGLQSMADRFTYIPHIGLFIAVVWACAEAAPRFSLSRALPVAASLVIVLLAVAAHAQVAYWQDDISLFSHALDATSDANKVAHFNLAAGYMNAGDYADAEREYRAAGDLKDADVGLHSALIFLGSQEFKAGRPADAQKYYAEAVQIKPDNYETRMNYGTLLSQLGRDAEAEEQFQYAAKLHPDSIEPLVYGALVAAKIHRFDTAIGDVQRAIAVDHDGSNTILIRALRLQPRPAAIDEYLTFLRQQNGGH